MANEVSEPMEVVMVPIVGKVGDNGVVEFDLEALYKVDSEPALELIKKMKGETGKDYRS
jgi:hypothetical protein